MSTGDTIYESNFLDTYESLKIRSRDSGFSIQTVRNELESLYKYEGMGWAGQGELKHSEIGGSISAYQVFLNEWAKAERE